MKAIQVQAQAKSMASLMAEERSNVLTKEQTSAYCTYLAAHAQPPLKERLLALTAHFNGRKPGR